MLKPLISLFTAPSLTIYNLAIRIYYLFIYIAAYTNPKARQWINGRKKQAQKIIQDLAHIHPKQKRIWIHCASLGEFEQGRPLIEAIKQQSPETFMILTFFSPSGYEIRKNYAKADAVYYLPLDTDTRAQQFIQTIQPHLAIFVKYEFWYHHLHQLQQQNVPTILMAALFRPNQIFFRWYGGLFRQLLKKYTHIFVQNQSSLQLLQKNDIQNVSIAADPRLDRVFNHARQVKPIPLIAQFKGKQQLLVAGSTWAKDEIILAKLMNSSPQQFKFIIAPHEIKEAQIQQLEKCLTVSSIRYSTLIVDENNLKQPSNLNCKVLIVDNIGLLSSIYQYANYAYIGGGFGVGIHNILEAAVFGMPIFFGPHYKKFQEAKDLVTQKGAFPIDTVAMLEKQFSHLQNNNKAYQQAVQVTENYITSQKGGTDKVLQFLNTYQYV